MILLSKSGTDRVSGIISLDTLKARAAIRDVGRVLGVSYQICDRAAKQIDFRNTLDEALKESEELSQMYRSDTSVRKLIDLARQLEGMPRHASTHAAGVVISAVPLSDLVPLQKNDGTVVTQYTMTVLESLGLLKMDFLGLRNLTIIRDTVNEIRRTQPDFDINSIPLDDREVYSMLSAGDTAGVFQLESEGMTQRLMELCPERLEDLIVVISLYRPGPMKSIPVYIENKRDPSKVRYKHPMLKEILEDTYGCMVYQEQVMEICRRLAGYSYGHADIVRRAMAKKKHEVMLKERESFVSGAVSNGVPEKTANEVFDEMVSFASYAFNKSHAAAYAYLAYQTAYLKCHYRGIYMAALMSSVMGMTGKLSEYINACRSAGIEIHRPDVNKSMKGFTYTDGKMYFGLVAIKNAGSGLADRIIAERNANGDFTGLQDLCERLSGRDLNKKSLENLIKSGALDGLGANRHQMLDSYEKMLELTGSGNRGVIEGQLNFLEAQDTSEMNMKMPYRAEFDFKKLLSMEKEAVGMYISGSPLTEFRYLSELLHVRSISSVTAESGSTDGQSVRLLCTILEKKLHKTKNGDKMCFLTLSDDTGEVDAVVFPDLFAVYGPLLVKDAVFVINGRISVKDESISIICTSAVPEGEFVSQAGMMKLCIKTTAEKASITPELTALCRKYSGTTQICFYLTDLKKTVSPKNKLSIAVTPESFAELSQIFTLKQVGLIR